MRIITFNVQMHWVTLAITLAITADACVQSASGPADILQHQALVSHDDALGYVIVEHLALQSTKYGEKRNEPWVGKGERKHSNDIKLSTAH